MNVENLTETIKKSRPNIKDSTIKQYLTNLNKLRKLFDSEDFSFLSNPEEVKDKIKELHFTSQRNHYNAIIVLLNSFRVLNKENNKFDNVKKKLADKHFTTQRNYYNSIIILLMAIDKDKKLIEEYNEVRDELNAKYTENQQSGVISDKQKNNFISLEELKGMINNIKNDLQLPKLKKRMKLLEKVQMRLY